MFRDLSNDVYCRCFIWRVAHCPSHVVYDASFVRRTSRLPMPVASRVTCAWGYAISQRAIEVARRAQRAL